MNSRYFTVIASLSACLSVATVWAGADEASPPATEPVAIVSADGVEMSAEDALRREVEAQRARAIQMRGPRDAHMAAMGRITQQVEVRRKEILAENEEAAALEGEIAELERALEEKTTALASIYDEDERLQELRGEMLQARDAYNASQAQLRETILKQHRDRQHLVQQVREEAAAKAAEAAEQAGDSAE